jgi:hypothetical protein
MSEHQPPFNWVEFPEGRARFSGGIRGVMDDYGHDTFSVELDGVELYGEIQRKFMPNKNDFNVEVVWFGYASKNYVGMPMMGTCEVFSLEQVQKIQSLIVQLVATTSRSDEKPSLMVDYPTARFMGRVFFCDGWILVADQEIAS